MFEPLYISTVHRSSGGGLMEPEPDESQQVSVETFQYMANVLTADTVTFISSVESVIESVNAFPIAFREYLDARFRLQIEQEFNLLHFAEQLEISGTEYEATATRIWNKTHGRIKSLQELEKKASAVAEVAQ